MYVNRKPCVAIESHVLQQKTRKQIVAAKSLLRQKKLCVATESHAWQQKAIRGHRKSWVATESHWWQKKAMGGNRRQPCVAIGSQVNATRKPTFLPSEAKFSMGSLI
jgi:hypothetical protein